MFLLLEVSSTSPDLPCSCIHLTFLLYSFRFSWYACPSLSVCFSYSFFILSISRCLCQCLTVWLFLLPLTPYPLFICNYMRNLSHFWHWTVWLPLIACIGRRVIFLTALRVRISVSRCICTLTCARIWACRVCWPRRYTTGHLYRPSAPMKLPLGVGVLTMFWTISSNKSQPKLLVSVSLVKWQTVHPPKSWLLPNRHKERGKTNKNAQSKWFLRHMPFQTNMLKLITV